jgi:DNA-binding NarL/FixJ family response regulator
MISISVRKHGSVSVPYSLQESAEHQITAACGLTLRQAEVALLVAEGRTNPEITVRLGISRFTARNHAEQILARLKVESRWQVARALCDMVAAAAGARGGPPGSQRQ